MHVLFSCFFSPASGSKGYLKKMIKNVKIIISFIFSEIFIREIFWCINISKKSKTELPAAFSTTQSSTYQNLAVTKIFSEGMFMQELGYDGLSVHSVSQVVLAYVWDKLKFKGERGPEIATPEISME